MKTAFHAAHYTGGRIEKPEEAEEGSSRRCTASQCPMPGNIFLSGSRNGMCAWHYGTQPGDWNRITGILKDFSCVVYESNEARRVVTSTELMCDVKALQDCKDAAWDRLAPLIPGREEELQPKPREDYGTWGKRLEAYLGGLVLQAIRTRKAA